jgi:protein TonB
MIGFAAQDLADLRRWVICGAVVVLAHAAVAAGLVTWHEPVEGVGAAAGIVIELAPVPIAPATSQSEVRPGPELDPIDSPPTKKVESAEDRTRTEEHVEAKREQVEEKVESQSVEEPPLEAPPAPNPDVAIQPSPKQVETEARAPQEERPLMVAAAPKVVAEQLGETPAAPRQGALNPYDSTAARTWQARIVALIERNKRYPAVARSRGQAGMARVVFTIDRQGRLLDSHVTNSSGVAVLDEEALALLRRSEPFPAAPSELKDDRVTFNLPLNFGLKSK